MKRATSQHLIPLIKDKAVDTYDLYPSHPLKNGKIEIGYDSLAQEISKDPIIILEGYAGVDWNEVVSSLTEELQALGKTVHSMNIQDCMKPEAEILKLVEPYLGGDDPIFGFKTKLQLKDWFDESQLQQLKTKENTNVNLIYGSGASLSSLEGRLLYFDLPKNELQYRMRAGEITNLGLSRPKAAKQAYKHFYFVDWVVLNQAKKELLPHIDIIVDQQRPAQPSWTSGKALRASLDYISSTHFRVRPWFEPGVWGGQWIKEKIKGLNSEVPNYAWSFEMIVPENGLLLEDEGKLLEVSFDMLMFHQRNHVLGKAAARFKDEFPIRFDFLDTFDGGNLSVQCHPKPDYIKKHFGENFTQDETYYILDAEENADVYLGFQEGIESTEFKAALEHSYQTKEELNVEKYVQKLPAKKHDLFLIPHGTIHCSGKDNLVLEISATPYIYTFKMYDWQRLDLDGNPRPLNIERAFENLNFEHQGEKVQQNLISKPSVVEDGSDWKKIHLPTHSDHFYDIYRYEFDSEMEIETQGQCHLLMLVEGEGVRLEVENANPAAYQYAETFAIPAAAKRYTLRNLGDQTAKVVVSFVKEEAC
ncbi:mannose-6-phosphate isomerase class I [Catalinimonas alkaloidigena]|uniref:class I mannose-6-phosphate isomerase n=1 Tax=Catalinimonas alkaloidigena TaxID=1075417 RepID=UPI002404DC10|nr:class I mannose-6-phosphate isomerase [Catalinimonas alkaloidigena]MDF9796485.1 mannose-6-phosphate isomerase class I [Catalinimonas alkaloidigena]